MNTTIIGGGNMGEALLAGLLTGTKDVAVVELSAPRAEYLSTTYGVRVTDLQNAVATADALVITVKPYHVAALLDELNSLLHKGQLIISAVGGTPIGDIEARLPSETAVIRSMPNLPGSLGVGAIALCGGRHVGANELNRARELLSPLGSAVEVTEAQLDTVTALSGAGPAYFALLAEALVDAGVLAGLPRSLASQLVLATAAGTGRLLGAPDADPAQLRAAVCSPGGATIAGIHELESRAVRAAVMSAVVAARDRSAEMGR